jgi:hypothetical protein
MDEIDGLGQLTDYRRLCSDLTLQTKKEGFFKVYIDKNGLTDKNNFIHLTYILFLIYDVNVSYLIQTGTQTQNIFQMAM